MESNVGANFIIFKCKVFTIDMKHAKQTSNKRVLRYSYLTEKSLLLTGNMPKKRLLSRMSEYNYYHYTWSFTYRPHPTGSNIQHLDKMDLDFVSDRDQIKIWNRSVKTYVQQATDIVSVFMKLLAQVDCIIIFRFGKCEPVCYAENQGTDVYPGSFLDINPFTFDEELRCLRMLRGRRKYLF